MHRQDLLNRLRNYRASFMEERAYVQRAISYIQNNPDCFEREHGPIHITASVWVVNPDRDRILMVHHGKLHQWFQPGGHADGDADVLQVALKEASEETGLNAGHIHLLSPEIFDVDIHDIPAIGSFTPHGHIDIRFLVEIDDSLTVPGSHESHEVRWIELYQVTSFNNFRSTYRMVEKTRRLRFSSLTKLAI
ncbi:MAG: NUDIX hydrolase [Chromatiales bacterium]|jgi:8-oxo-dGTP pyrophosphatase MutT (NUDIX family)